MNSTNTGPEYQNLKELDLRAQTENKKATADRKKLVEGTKKPKKTGSSDVPRSS